MGLEAATNGGRSVHVCHIRIDFALSLHTLISITKLLERNNNMKLLGITSIEMPAACFMRTANCISFPSSDLTPLNPPCDPIPPYNQFLVQSLEENLESSCKRHKLHVSNA